MGNTQILKKANFEDVQHAIKNNDTHLLINTMPENLQNCLIVNTLPYDKEEIVINKILSSDKMNSIVFIIYGKNTNDDTVNIKYKQLIDLGFKNVYIYQGGLFEWCLLQDIYSCDLFQTTSKVTDLLKFKPNKNLNISLIEY